MPAPAPLSTTYHTRANVPFGANNTTTLLLSQFFIWSFKAALMDQLSTGTTGGAARGVNSVWTCLGSSNGTTGALDGVDRWTSTFTPANLVRALSGSPHSWIVLRNSTLGYDICLDMNSASDGTFGLIATKSSQPFIVAGVNPQSTRPQTSGNAEEFAIGTASSPTASTTVSLTADVTLLQTRHSHFVTDANGNFYFFTTRVGGGCSGWIAFLPGVGGAVDDTRNRWWLLSATNGTNINANAAPLYGALVAAAGGGAVRRNFNGGIPNSSFGIRTLFSMVSFSWSANSDISTGEYSVWPMELTSPNTGIGNTSLYCGTFPDLYFTAAVNSQGASYPTVGTMERTIIGCALFPCAVPIAQ